MNKILEIEVLCDEIERFCFNDNNLDRDKLFNKLVIFMDNYEKKVKQEYKPDEE